MARTPTLSSPLSPFGNSGSVFGAFAIGGGQAPLQKALSDASEARYEVGLRYNNGQASDSEYQAAVAAELAIAVQIAASSDPSIAASGKQHVAELQNLQHDISQAHGEAVASGQGDEALLAYYQSEIGGMDPSSTAAIRMQKTITDLQTTISNKAQAAQDKADSDAARQSSYEFQSAQLAWHDGDITNDAYLAAYQKYVSAQKPGTAEQANAQDALNQATYGIHRNDMLAGVRQGTKTLDDLLAFDQQALGQVRDHGSETFNERLANVQDTQSQIFQQAASKTNQDFNDNKITATQALSWYQSQLAHYTGNPSIVSSITSQINTFQGRQQDEQDNAAITAYNNGKMSPSTFAAYSTTRAAAYGAGTGDQGKWQSYAVDAKNKLVESTLNERYGLSQDYVTLEKFITDNSGPIGTGASGERIVMGADGHWTIQQTPGAPSSSDIAAFQQRQAEVADAKRQLAALQPKITAAGGFQTTAAMLTWYTGLQGQVAKGSTQWFTYQDKINALQDRQHYEDVLANSGVKVSYPDVTATGAGNPTRGTTGGSTAGASGGSGGGPALGGGGGGGPRPGTSVGGGSALGSLGGSNKGTVGGSTLVKPASGVYSYGGHAEEFRGGAYTSAQIDYVANRIAAGTGLDPRVTRLWVTKEQGHVNNPLGVSQGGDAGQMGILSVFSSVDKGIDEAIRWINTHGNMRGIKDSVGKSPQEQIAAIDRSPWGPGGGRGGYNGSLEQLASQVGYRMPAVTPGGAPGAPPTAGGKAVPPPPPPKPNNGITVDQFLTSLGKVAGNGDYFARNNATSAYGKYQIAPSDWTAWATQYLHDPRAEQSPDNQEKVAKARALDLYGQLGSWQAVAHAWLVPGADVATNEDPSKWGAFDSQWVTSIIGGAGGRVEGVGHEQPPAKPVTPVIATPGSGVPSQLRQIVSSSITDEHGVPTRSDVTKPVDFPKNLSADAFDTLYSAISGGVQRGDYQATFRGDSGAAVQILLPDNPQARANLMYDMDNRNIALASARAAAAKGTVQEAAANAAIQTAVTQSAKNTLTLLDQNYGGERTVVDTVTGKTITEKRGERANPNTGPTNVQLSKMTAAGRTEALTTHYGGVQTASLTPIAAGVRLLDQATRFIADQTQMAQDAIDRSDFDAAVAHIHMATQYVQGYGSIHDQINTYVQQSEATVGKIEGATGINPSDVPATVSTDVSRLENAGSELRGALAPLQELAAKSINPYVKTDSKGNIQFDSVGRVQLKPNVVIYGDPKPEGGYSTKPTFLPASGYDERGQLRYEDPARVPIAAKSSTDKPTVMYVPWTTGTVGYINLPDGEQIPVPGRIAAGTNGWVEDPFNQGHWAPGPIAYTLGKDPSKFDAYLPSTIKNVAATDSSGNPLGGNAIGFDYGGMSYKLQLDPKTGNLVVIQQDPQSGKVEVVGGVNSGDARTLFNAATGITLDPSKLTRDQMGFLTGPTNAAWPGSKFDDVARYLAGDRMKVFSQQVVNAATKLIGDPFGAIRSMLGGSGQPAGPTSWDHGDASLGYPASGSLGPPPFVNPSPTNYWYQGGGLANAELTAVQGSAGAAGRFAPVSNDIAQSIQARLAASGAGAGAISLIPVLGAAGYVPPAQAMATLGVTPQLTRSAQGESIHVTPVATPPSNAGSHPVTPAKPVAPAPKPPTTGYVAHPPPATERPIPAPAPRPLPPPAAPRSATPEGPAPKPTIGYVSKPPPATERAPVTPIKPPPTPTPTPIRSGPMKQA